MTGRFGFATHPYRLLAVFVSLLGIAVYSAPAARAETAAGGPMQTGGAGDGGTRFVRASLAAEHTVVTPGGQVWLAVHLEVAPGWHIYWLNPGDSGLAPALRWQTGPALTVGPPLFPVPARIPFEPLVNFGYEGEVIMLVPVTVASTVLPGTPLALDADAEWLVCKEQCIPESARLALVLTAGSTTSTDAGGAPEAARTPAPAADLFARARARLPVERAWPAGFAATDRRLALRIEVSAAERARLPQGPVWFFPLDDGVIDHAAAQTVVQDATALTLTAIAGSAIAGMTTLEGLLTFAPAPVTAGAGAGTMVTHPVSPGRPHLTQTPPAGTVGVRITARSMPTSGSTSAPTSGSTSTPTSGSTSTPTSVPTSDGDRGDWAVVLAVLGPALLGGILLNVMPCVFPVLMLKLLGLVEVARTSRRQAAIHGLAFTGGVMATFLSVAAALLGLRGAGTLAGWGFQLQSPPMVLGLAWLLFAIGLSLSGVFALGHRLTNIGSTLMTAPGVLGSFFGGVLATLVATPCTAPFMGVAVGVAVTLAPLQALTVFAALGFGMALPFLLVSLVPGARTWLPRPGAWMVRFKEALAFPMYASALWLVWVLSEQGGPSTVLAALKGAWLIGLGGWLYEATRHARPGWRFAGLAGVAAAAILLLGLLRQVGTESAPGPQALPATAPAAIPWQPFSPAAVAAGRSAGHPVFVDFTAAWCLTCLFNERLTLAGAPVATAFREHGVVALRADWTRHDPVITAALAEFGRNGVPLYLFYPGSGGGGGGGGAPSTRPAQILPQILTESLLLELLETDGLPPIPR